MLYAECSAEDYEIAKNELNEVEEEKSAQIRELRNLCYKSSEIGEVCYDRLMF